MCSSLIPEVKYLTDGQRNVDDLRCDNATEDEPRSPDLFVALNVLLDK